MEKIIHIKPQPGFQTKVANSKADITIIGGAAGGGKSFIMLYIPLLYKDDPDLRVVFFRRTQAQIREAGAVWDESTKLYSLFSAEPSESILKWRFTKGGIIDFNGLQYEKDLINFQGAAIPLIFFDELTHFTKKQFFYLLSRNRAVLTKNVGCIQKPQVFASCNPDPDSWVANLIAWYIDQETGYPIQEREGKIRYFMVDKEKVIWGNTKREVFDKNPKLFQDPQFVKSGIHPSHLIKSFTFIGGTIYENKKLLQSNPQYLGNLMSQSEADQERLLKGNWKIRADNTGIYDNKAIERIFVDARQEFNQEITWQIINGVPIQNFRNTRDYANNFITCDAAKFGRDLCIIFVWNKFTVIHTTVFYHSSPEDIHKEIQLLMIQKDVLRKNVLIDQDGVGGDVVKLGGYYGFMARRECAVDPTTGQKENYVKRKDQCYYRSANRVNNDGLKIILLPSTVKIYDRGSRHPRWSCELDWDGEKVHIRVLIEKQLRAIKRGNVEIEMGLNKYEGGDIKLCTNTKEEQKEILGCSPDLADCIMMREDFELSRYTKGEFDSY